jgi:hypothetical protein
MSLNYLIDICKETYFIVLNKDFSNLLKKNDFYYFLKTFLVLMNFRMEKEDLILITQIIEKVFPFLGIEFIFFLKNWWKHWEEYKTDLLTNLLVIPNIITLGLLIDAFIRMRKYEA